MDLTGALDQVVGEVDVVEEVRGTGQHRPVAAGAGHHVVDALGQRGHLVLRHHPDPVHIGGQLLGLAVDRLGVAAHAAVPVGRVDGELGVQRKLALRLVVARGERLLRLRARRTGGRAQAPTGGESGVEGAERGVLPAAHQLRPEPLRAAREREAVGAVGAVERGDGDDVLPAALRHRGVRGQQLLDGAVEEQPAYGAQGRARLDERHQVRVRVDQLQRGRARRRLRLVRETGQVALLAVLDTGGAQRGDGVGDGERLERVHALTVRAGAEGQALALGEGAADRAVPGHRRDVEEAGAPGEGVRARGHAAQQLQRPGHPGLAAERALAVAEHQHIGIADGVQPVRDVLQRARQVDVVALQEEEVVPGGTLGPGVAPAVGSRALGQVDGLDPAVACGELVQQQSRTVRSAVIHTDHLDVRERLREHRLQALAQTSSGAADGDDDTQPGHTDSFSDCAYWGAHRLLRSAQQDGHGTGGGATVGRQVGRAPVGRPVGRGHPVHGHGRGDSGWNRADATLCRRYGATARLMKAPLIILPTHLSEPWAS